MIDPIAAAMLAVTARSPAALGLVFLAGLVTSIGPCIAPRYITIAALTSGERRPIVPTLAFVAGLVGAFMTLGYVAGLLGALWAWSAAIYGILAVGLIAGGSIALVRAVPQDHRTCTSSCDSSRRSRSLGASFLLGVASAFIVSPCCTPIVAAVVAMSTAIGNPLIGVTLLGSFAAGHTLPLFFAGTVGTLVRSRIPQHFTGQAPAIIGAVLMLVLGVYYGVLA